MGYRDDYREVQRDAFWTMPRAFLAIVAVMVLMYGLGFLATGGELAIYQFWAPKQANAQRVVFENTQSYVQGKQEYLSRLRYQFQSAEIGAQKDALRTLILSEASTVDVGKLSPDLQAFLRSIGGAQ